MTPMTANRWSDLSSSLPGTGDSVPRTLTVARDEAVGGSVDNVTNLREAGTRRDLVDELVGRGEDATLALPDARCLETQKLLQGNDHRAAESSSAFAIGLAALALAAGRNLASLDVDGTGRDEGSGKGAEE